MFRQDAVDSLTQAAVLAWSKLSHTSRAVSVARVLKHDAESFVCQLSFDDQGVTDVVAKTSPHGDSQRLLREFRIYEEILCPHQIATPRYYGVVTENDKCWLFQQAIAGLRFRSSKREHRSLLARWLASVHLAFADNAPSGLPPLGLNEPLMQLSRALERLRDNVSADIPAYRAERLEEVRQACLVLQSRWDTIEAIFTAHPAPPNTLVHRDLKSENVKLCDIDDHQEPVVLDWEHAGFGPPAFDLASDCIKLRDYWPIVHKKWDGLMLDDLERHRKLGQLFRRIWFLEWALDNLGGELDRDAWILLMDTNSERDLSIVFE